MPLLPRLAAAAVAAALLATVRAGAPAAGGAAEQAFRPFADPAQLDVPWPKHSHYKQPWRAWIETRSGRAFLDGIGVNYNVPGDPDLPVRLLAEAGFRTFRIEIGWGGVRWDEEGFSDEARLAKLLAACRARGIRPLVLLNAHQGVPCPVRFAEKNVTVEAPAGSRSVRLADLDGIVPGRTGLSGLTDYWAAEAVIVRADPATGACDLSKPLPEALPAGRASLATLKYLPLHPVGTPEFEETAAGWTRYAKLAARLVRAAGIEEFDVEVWNELTFGSRFLDADNYFDPPVAKGKAELPPAPGTGHGSLQRACRVRRRGGGGRPTHPHLRVGRYPSRPGYRHCNRPLPADGRWGSGEGPPPQQTDGLHEGGAAWEIARRTVEALREFPGARPIWGFSNTTFFHTPVPELPPGIAGQSYHPYGTGERKLPEGEYMRDRPETNLEGFTPRIAVRMPEGWAHTFIQTESLMRLINPEARKARPPGAAGFRHLMTEHGIVPAECGLRDPGRGWELKAKGALRAYCLWLGKGIDALHWFCAFEAKSLGMGILPPDVAKLAPEVPFDRAATLPLRAVRRLTEAFEGSAPIDSPRQLTVEVAPVQEGKPVFAGDASHPPLRHRDVLAVLPFQLDAARFACAVYVMTWDATAPFEEETYRLRIGNLPGPVEGIELRDPLEGRKVEAKRLRDEGGVLEVELPVVDSPRILLIATGASPVTVKDASGLREALARARPGSTVLVEPGVYEGGIFADGPRGEDGRPVVVRGKDPKNPPIFRGGATAFHLVRPAHVRLENLVIEKTSSNGINIDDGGKLAEPARDIVLRGIAVRDNGPRGNHDGIKLSGLSGFRIEDCTVERWSAGGSAIDMVGCHEGVIGGCTFRGDGAEESNGVQAKGGSSRIAVRECRFEDAGGRAINIGGSTGRPFFRPPLGEGKDHAEARDIAVEGNTFVGGGAPVAFVGVDGAAVRFNTIYRPRRWVLRILQETRAPDFVPCRNGAFEDNIVAFRSDELRAAANVGSDTAPETFRFARNFWWCIDRPDRSRPSLPAAEKDGVQGTDPLFADAEKGDLSLRPGSPAAKAGAGAAGPR
jgi:hypothetical protein